MDNLFELVMIVKDAEDCIEKTLRYARNLVSRWTILDTGSSDNTKAIIQTVMADMPGNLYEEPFVDFETTRNRAFELASKQCKYYIVLDDTYLVTNAVELKKQVLARPNVDAFNMVIQTQDELYYNCRITKVGKNLRYKYKVHEIIDSPAAKTVNLPPSCVLLDNTNAYHTKRTLIRQERDFRHLTDDLKRFPADPYVLYNLGRNRFNLRKYDEAIQYLQQCIHNKQPSIHAYDACLLLASIYQKQRQPSERVINLFKMATEIDTHHIEAFFHLAATYYQQGAFEEALRYIKKAWKLLQDTANITGTQQMRKVEVPHLYLECLIQKGEFTKAQEVLVACLKNNPHEIRFQNTAYAVTPRNPNHTIHTLDAPLCVLHAGGDTCWNPENPSISNQTEIMSVKLAQIMVSRGWKVMVFGNFINDDVTYETKSRGVEFIDQSKYGDMCLKYKINVLLVCNRSNNLVFFDHIDQVYLWTHALGPSTEGSIQVHKTKFKGLVTFSNFQREAIRKTYPVPDDMFVNISFAINVNNFKSQRTKTAGRFVFNDLPSNGLSAAIRIVERVREFLPEAHLRILADTRLLDTDSSELIKTRDWIKVVPVDTQAAVAVELLNAQWFIAPTESEDAASVPILEAMAAGCSVVVSKVGALPEIVGSGGTCIPLKSFSVDEDSFVHRIHWLCENDPVRVLVSEKAREKAMGCSYQSVADSLLATFERNKTG